MTTDTTTGKSARTARISYFVILSLVAFIFLASGILKFTANEEIVNNFSKWGILKWKEAIGAAEILGTILYLLPRTNLWGTLILTALMGGAILTHLAHEEPFYFNLAIVLTLWINFIVLKPRK